MTPSEGLSLEQRFAYLERDVQSHAKTLTAHNDNLARVNAEAIRQEERDKSLDERLGRIEKSIADSFAANTARFNGIYKLGWWILAAFGGSFIALLTNFLFKGGLVI